MALLNVRLVLAHKLPPCGPSGPTAALIVLLCQQLVSFVEGLPFSRCAQPSPATQSWPSKAAANHSSPLNVGWSEVRRVPGRIFCQHRFGWALGLFQWTTKVATKTAKTATTTQPLNGGWRQILSSQVPMHIAKRRRLDSREGQL